MWHSRPRLELHPHRRGRLRHTILIHASEKDLLPRDRRSELRTAGPKILPQASALGAVLSRLASPEKCVAYAPGARAKCACIRLKDSSHYSQLDLLHDDEAFDRSCRMQEGA